MINFKIKKLGFTIVELLVVIVVIGVLAAITIVAYTGITQRAVASSLQSDLSNASRQLKLFQVDNGYYPTTISSDCVTQPDTATNKCLRNSAGTVYQYAADNISNPPNFSLTAIKSQQTYSISGNGLPVAGDLNLLSGDTSIERTSANEFIQYADLASIFDGYGIRQYTISFDIKSANISVQNTIKVYMQNGSGARYTFSASVPVTTSYSRQSVTVTPALSNVSLTQSKLAFYGTYGTGNIASVKNVKVEIGGVATDWTLAP